MSADLSDLATTDNWEALLTSTELRLVEHAARGEVLDLRTGEAEADSVNQVDTWGEDRTVRGRVLECLILMERHDWPLHHRGLKLIGARIVGQVDLDFATVPTQLAFWGCLFDQPVRMVGATLKALTLYGTRLPGLIADGVDVAFSLGLNQGFTSTGEVRLTGANIGVWLDCSGGSFRDEDGVALGADGIHVGAVELSDGFTATGQVRMVGAKIAAALNFAGGSFRCDDGVALIAEGIEVGGNVYLRDGFTATGEIWLRDANIGGSLVYVVPPTWCSTPPYFSWRVGSVDLRGASAGLLADNVVSWPFGWLGDGFTYRDFADDASVDVKARLRWLLAQGGAFRPGPYSHLAAVYRRRGDPAAARAVLIARERRRTRTLRLWRRPLRRVWGVVSAYGYRPWRAIALLAALIAVAGFAFMDAAMAELASDDQRVMFDPWLYSADLAIPLVDLRQAGDYQPKEIRAQRWMWGTVALGWFLSGAFVAAASGIFKPDE